jgi:hypothetical protein
MIRSLSISLSFLLAGITPLFAQTHLLQETVTNGQCFRVEIDTIVKGEMKLSRDGKIESAAIEAHNQHQFLEKVLSESNGMARKVARHYAVATSASDSAKEKLKRELRTDRKLIVAQQLDGQLICYSPNGPMSRQEWELAQEHFDALPMVGLLPNKETAVGDTWKLNSAVVQSLSSFEALIQQDLVAKFIEVKDGMAILSFEGKANGVEGGAMVNVEVTAQAKFDLLKHRVVQLDWKQKEIRDQGPISPAMELVITTTAKRALLDKEPAELNSTALVSVPSEEVPPGLLMQLSHKDARSRYQFLYSRDWRIVGQTDSHLVLRLLDRGDLVAQANITWLTKTDDGKHLTPEEFKQMIGRLPGWELEEVVDASEVPGDPNRYLYRVMARGNLDGVAVAQVFYLLAGPKGDQLAITFTMKPSNLTRVGTKDLSLVTSIDFLSK